MGKRKTGDTENTQSDFWMFTINNPTDEDFNLLMDLKNNNKVVYCVFQKEKGDKEGTEHFQGMIELASKMRRRTVAKLLPRANLQTKYAKSTKLDCYNYVTKDKGRVDGPWKINEEMMPCYDDADQWHEDYGPKQGARTDIAEWAHKSIENCKTGKYDFLAEAVDNAMAENNAKYHVYKQKILNAAFPARSKPPKVIYLWGDSGVGKTVMCEAISQFTGVKNYYLSKDNGNGNLWIDGYVPGNTFIMDEFHSWIKYEDIKRFIDASPMVWQVKLGFTQFDSPIIVITSNLAPEYQYYNLRVSPTKKANQEIDERFALWRRFVQFGLVVHVKEQLKTMPKELVAFLKEERPVDSNGKVLPRPFPAKMTFKDKYPAKLMEKVAAHYRKEFDEKGYEEVKLYADDLATEENNKKWLSIFEESDSEEPESDEEVEPARKKTKYSFALPDMDDIIECESDSE